MRSFKDIFSQYSWQELSQKINAVQPVQVEQVLHKERLNWEDFLVLVSPEAAHYLEPIAARAKRATEKRFGKTVQMYVPMYLSNECQNICTYCGFSLDNNIPRVTLSDAQILNEVEAIKHLGFDHVLLVTGEAQQKVGVAYLENAIKLIAPKFSNVSIEVQPLEEEGYQKLRAVGLHAVLVYQETYNTATYKEYHTKGRKSNFEYRLDTPDRLGRAGIHKMGLGVLLGLEDWRVDSAFNALHLDYLRKKYWKSRFSVSFPRLRPAEGDFVASHHMNDRELLQLICAYRLLDENLELSLSTRESKSFRDNAFKLGITSMSAGSRTDPGGYAADIDALEQFSIDDERTPKEVAAMISKAGYEAVWKDWDSALS